MVQEQEFLWDSSWITSRQPECCIFCLVQQTSSTEQHNIFWGESELGTEKTNKEEVIIGTPQVWVLEKNSQIAIDGNSGEDRTLKQAAFS